MHTAGSHGSVIAAPLDVGVPFPGAGQGRGPRRWLRRCHCRILQPSWNLEAVGCGGVKRVRGIAMTASSIEAFKI